MQRRTIGNLEVSALGLGCMGMSEFYGPSDDEQSLSVLHRAVELGISFFDTADVYGPHANERLLARFIRESDATLQIATKFGIVRKAGEYRRTIDNSAAYTKRSCEASLKRLGIDCIDLYYVHRVDSSRPIEDVMSTLAELVREGKIAHIGLCEVSADTLQRAHAVHPVTAVQTEYSLWTRDPESDVIPACRSLGIGFVPYSPLGRGFLTGTFDGDSDYAEGDFRASLPRFERANLRRNLRIVDAVRTLANETGCTPAQLSLAWLLARGPDIVPIPGTRRLDYLMQNAAATQVNVTPDQWRALEHALAGIDVAGERYTEEGMKGVNA